MRAARIAWPLSVLEVALAIALALLLPRLENHFGWDSVISYDPATAQATLAAIAGGMITLTGFVLTAVTLMVQTIQGQSPRLLRILDRSDGTPLLFGTFIATFTFALLVLSQVHSDSVPSFSVTVAVLLVLVSACLFLRLLVTFRGTLTTGGLVHLVGNALRGQIGLLYRVDYDPDAPAGAGGRVAAGRAWELAHTGPPGIFQALDERAAVRLATQAGGEITFFPAIGDFVVTGTLLAAGTGTPPDPAALARVVRTGMARTLDQDPAYGIRVLVDIAIRALSPAVNDPTSAVQSLDQIDDVMHRLARLALGDGLFTDDDGRVVVRLPAPRWDLFVALAFDEIIAYGAGSIQVARRLRALLQSLLATAPPDRRPPVEVRLATLNRLANAKQADPALNAEAAKSDPQGIGSPRCQDS